METVVDLLFGLRVNEIPNRHLYQIFTGASFAVCIKLELRFQIVCRVEEDPSLGQNLGRDIRVNFSPSVQDVCDETAV